MRPVAAKKQLSPLIRSSVEARPRVEAGRLVRRPLRVALGRKASLDLAAHALQGGRRLTPSGVPPMPNSASTPDCVDQVATAP